MTHMFKKQNCYVWIIAIMLLQFHLGERFWLSFVHHSSEEEWLCPKLILSQRDSNPMEIHIGISVCHGTQGISREDRNSEVKDWYIGSWQWRNILSGASLCQGTRYSRAE